jgi:hypothetical protein
VFTQLAGSRVALSSRELGRVRLPNAGPEYRPKNVVKKENPM